MLRRRLRHKCAGFCAARRLGCREPKVLVSGLVIVPRRDQRAVPQPSRRIGLGKPASPIGGTARPKVLKQPGPVLEPGTRDDPPELGPKVRPAGTDAGQDELHARLGQLEQVRQDRSQLGHDGRLADGVPLVPSRLRAPHRQGPSVPIDIAPAKQS